MVSDNFRRQLRQEAELWRAEGLIDTEQYQQLSERYQFKNLETVARDRFLMVLIGVGSILLGLGVITFVAANWQAVSRELKFMLLLTLFLVVNIAGFYLWRQPNQVNRRQHRMGQGLLLLGAVILGANMALLAQMFHINGSSYQLLLSWGLGVLAMAYSLRLTFLGLLAILLVQLGYWIGLEEALSSPGEFSWLQLIVQHMPLLAGLLFVPLAYWCRSSWMFVLALVAVVTSVQFNLKPLEILTGSTASPGWACAIAFALPPALLWGYDDLVWPNLTARVFQPLARNLALLFLGILFYTLSFHWFWQTSSYQSVENNSPLSLLPLVDIVVLSGLALFEWLYLVRQPRKRRFLGGMDLSTSVIACFIAITALVPFWHLSVNPIGVIATITFNALLSMLACGLIHKGLTQGQRHAFWGGIVLLTLQILSRMLEYETNLLFKSFVFILCGVGVISAGFWFERHLSALSTYKKGSHEI